MVYLVPNSKSPQYELVFTDRYRDNLNQIHTFLVANWWDTSVDRFYSELNHRFDLLENMPKMYAFYDEYEDYRSLVVWDFLILYYFDETHNKILVDRIIHESRDVARAIYD